MAVYRDIWTHDSVWYGFCECAVRYRSVAYRSNIFKVKYRRMRTVYTISNTVSTVLSSNEPDSFHYKVCAPFNLRLVSFLSMTIYLGSLPYCLFKGVAITYEWSIQETIAQNTDLSVHNEVTAPRWWGKHDSKQSALSTVMPTASYQNWESKRTKALEPFQRWGARNMVTGSSPLREFLVRKWVNHGIRILFITLIFSAILP